MTMDTNHGVYQSVHAMVLGASGFIGRWLSRQLQRAGARTTLVVRDRERAEAILRPLGVQGALLERDLSVQSAVADLIRSLRPSIVFNLVSYGGYAGQHDASRSQVMNEELVKWLLDAIATSASGDCWPGVRLLHVGSGAEYGVIAGPISEGATGAPTNVYGRTKLAGTRLVAAAARARALPAMTARLFMVYGPGEPAQRLLPSIIAAAGDDKVLQLTAGTQLKDFTYVEDVAEGLLRLGAVGGQCGAVANLATGISRSVRSFVEIAARELNVESGYLQFGARPTPQWETSHARIDIGRLVELTGWKPPTLPEEGIRRTVQRTRDRLSDV